MVKVAVETEEKTPLAVIYHGGELGQELATLLRREGLRVKTLAGVAAMLPAWEKPDYTFFFASLHVGREAVFDQWKEVSGRKILILENWESPFPAGADLTVRISGHVETDVAFKIVRFVFSPLPSRELEIFGKGAKYTTTPRENRSLGEIFESFNPRKKPVSKKLVINFLIVLLVFLLVAPFLALGVSTVAGFSAMAGAISSLRKNDLASATFLAQRASSDLAFAKNVVAITSPLLLLGGKDFTQRYYNFLGVGEKSADLVERGTRLLPESQELARALLVGTGSVDTNQLVADMRLELSPVNADLGFIEGQLDQFVTPRTANLLSFFGVAKTRLASYRQDLMAVRQATDQADLLLGAWNDLVPGRNQSKTYLVVFQNSAELRPTGGFIGSYGLVNLSNGKLANFKIYDVYAADGQLRGSIAPPDEILHYLGQTQWFMRDANFAPDFPLTAKRLEWFLEKETGVSASGVIAVNLGALSEFLKATGPLTLPTGESVSADNFFEKAEYAAEINFFPGSQQKPQYLSQVAQALFAKITSDPSLDWTKLATAVRGAVVKKDILVFFDKATVQTVVANQNLTGSLTGADLMLVDANFGANKANYFLKRSFRIDAVVDKGGGILTTVVVKYRNDSPNASWPGGIYKDYLRVLVPVGSRWDKFSLGDGLTASVSSLLTAEVIAATPPQSFLVFKSQEQGLSPKGEILPAADSYGTFFEIPPLSEKTVAFTYLLPKRLDFTKPEQEFSFSIEKQPGTGADSIDFALDYPSFLKPSWQENPLPAGISVLALPQKLVYNTDLSQDRVIKVKFKRQ